MSTISSWTSWKPRDRTCRTGAAPPRRRRDASRQRLADARRSRPRARCGPSSSADIATLKPAPSSPSRAASGTRTPSRKSSPVSWARRPSFPSSFAGREARRVGRHEEARDPARPLAARAREDERDAGPRAERDEDLRAAEHPVAAVALRARDEARRIRAGARLGQRVAAELLARRERRQQLALLLVRPPPCDRLADEAVVHRDDPPDRRVGPAELLHHEAVRDRVEPHSTVRLGERSAQEADLGELADDRPVHLLRAVPLTRVRQHLALDERTGRAADQVLLVAGREVHGPVSGRGRRAGPAARSCVRYFRGSISRPNGVHCPSANLISRCCEIGK